jgi:hypothetical protein
MASSPTLTTILANLIDHHGGGRDLLREIATAELLDSSDHIFTADIADADKRGIVMMARASQALLAHPAEADRFADAMMKGDWVSFGDIAETLARKADISPEYAMSYCLALLYVPACAVDAFAVAAVTQGKAEASAYKSMRTSPTTREHRALISSYPTRDTLVRTAAYASFSWLRDSKAIRFNLEQGGADRQRFERFSKVLKSIADNPAWYAEIMTHVAKDDWANANRIATELLQTEEAGETIDNPPTVADVLLLAIMAVCHTDATAKTVAAARSLAKARRPELVS